MLRIRELRKDAGLTQVQLAEAAGLSQATVSGLESGWPTTTATLEKLAVALEVDVVDLFDHGPTIRRSPAPT